MEKTKGLDSLKLSMILVYMLILMLMAGLFIVPLIAKWECGLLLGRGSTAVFVHACVMLYISTVLGIAAANALRILLGNIIKDKIFISDNTKCLRIISWCCIFVGVDFIAFSVWDPAFGLASFFAFFMGVIMRVLKNVFEKAVEIKSENDFTV